MSLKMQAETASTSDLQLASSDARLPWAKPEITVTLPVSQTQGNGGAGFDFASEVSL